MMTGLTRQKTSKIFKNGDEMNENKNSIAVIDLSAIYRRYWHASEGENMSSAKRKTLSFVRSLHSDYSEIIVALDCPPYKRTELYPEYKAHRQPMPEAIKEELKKTIESIANDGWKIARCEGYEADDIIATLVLQYNGLVDVYGSDKDLLQCCDLIGIDGKLSTSETRLGVSRDRVVDFLTLTGDSSDNIKGVHGVGAKTAVAMLDKFGSIKGIYDALAKDASQFKPKTVENLSAAFSWIDTTRQIIKLSDDLDLDIEQREVDRMSENVIEEDVVQQDVPQQENAMVVHSQPAVVRKIDVDYRNSLEPAGIDELWRVSSGMFQSGLYSGFLNAQGVMAAIMHGRELGLGAATSLSSIHVIKGKPTLSAEAMVAMVKASDKCEYLMCTERTDDQSTWVTKRVGYPKEVSFTFSMEDARKMEKASDYNYKKQPATMLMWRAASALCRQEYPDITKGLHSTEEML
jgi:5'-3' exonuclease